jgi:hypothetical protein
MMTPLFIAVIAVPFLVGVWVAAWLLGDLFTGRERAAIRVRPHNKLR